MPSLTKELLSPPALEGSTLHIGGNGHRLKPKDLLVAWTCLVMVACGGSPDARKPVGAEPDVAGEDAAEDVAEDAGVRDVREATPDIPGDTEDAPDTTDPLCDDFEPNDTPATATPLLEGGIDARICAGDVDWVAVPVRAGDRLDLALTFRHADGDLDLSAYDPDLVEWDRSDSADDNESLTVDVETSGTWWVQVYGFDSAEASYRLEIARQSGDPGCDDDEFEPDDVPRQAVTLHPPWVGAARLCAGDEDHRVTWLQAGARFEVDAGFSHASGDVDLEFMGPDGDIVASARSVTDREHLEVRARTDGLYTLRIVGFNVVANGVDYTLDASGDSPAPPHRVEGHVTFHDPYWDDANSRLGYHARALAGALVEVVGDGAVVGHGYTDGRGVFDVAHDRAATLYVRAVAARDGPEANVAVVDAQRRVYAVRQPGTFVAGDGAQVALTLADGPSLSAPFNTLDAASQGLEWWRSAARQGAPVGLHMLWQEGQSLECGTCYRDGDRPRTIYVLGLDSDNDALDDPVLLHELGHFLQNLYSHQDSPGGSHDGTPVDPRLAWAEGWATAFSAMVRADPVYFDTRGDRRTTYDIETPDEDYATFTGDSLDDPISEYLVAALVFDLWDADADGADALYAGPGAVLPLVEHLSQGQRAVRGADGVDLVDYLDGAVCLDLVDPPLLGARLREARLPYVDRDAVCDKPEAPLTVTNTWVQSHRRLDELTVFSCDRACDVIAKAADLLPGERLALPPHTGRLEVVAGRGHNSWAVVQPSETHPKPLWHSATPTHAGSPVVERIAR